MEKYKSANIDAEIPCVGLIAIIMALDYFHIITMKYGWVMSFTE